MKDEVNVSRALTIAPDYLGFIFHPPSPRYVGDDPAWIRRLTLPSGTRKVGVFVDISPERVLKTCQLTGIEVVQLHGKETPQVCRMLRKEGMQVIKMFSVGDGFDFRGMEAYPDAADYFLFDTKGPLPGGSGRSFDWELLWNYPFDTPFFLSGGIGPENVDRLNDDATGRMYALDVNSRVESVPGEKDMNKLNELAIKIITIRS